MTGPLLYPAEQKWKIGSALGAAVLVHLAAIVLGAIHYHQPSEEVLALPAGIVEVMIEAAPTLDDLIPPPDVEVPPPAPDLTNESLFPEERTSPPPFPAARQQADREGKKGNFRIKRITLGQGTGS